LQHCCQEADFLDTLLKSSAIILHDSEEIQEGKVAEFLDKKKNLGTILQYFVEAPK